MRRAHYAALAFAPLTILLLLAVGGGVLSVVIAATDVPVGAFAAWIPQLVGLVLVSLMTAVLIKLVGMMLFLYEASLSRRVDGGELIMWASGMFLFGELVMPAYYVLCFRSGPEPAPLTGPRSPAA
jgi:hypothetical protein